MKDGIRAMSKALECVAILQGTTRILASIPQNLDARIDLEKQQRLTTEKQMLDLLNCLTEQIRSNESVLEEGQKRNQASLERIIEEQRRNTDELEGVRTQLRV